MLTFDAVVTPGETDEVTLVVTGDLDLMTVPVFVAAATDVLNRDRVRSVHLDLSGVGFMDSAGINAVVKLDQTARDAGRTLELAASSPYVERVLRLVGLDDMFV